MNIKKHLKYGVVAATFAGIGMLASGIAANADTGKTPTAAVNQCVSDLKDDAGAVSNASQAPTAASETPDQSTTKTVEKTSTESNRVVTVDHNEVNVVRDVKVGDVNVLSNDLNNLNVNHVVDVNGVTATVTALTSHVTNLLSVVR